LIVVWLVISGGIMASAMMQQQKPVAAATGGAVQQDLLTPLLEALALEPKYQPALALPHTTKQESGQISMRMRNGSAHVLRCLKVWYDLPPDTFFNAVNIMDRFLTRMKAQPKHLSCIAVSAFHLSCVHTPGYAHLRDIPQVVPDSRD